MQQADERADGDEHQPEPDDEEDFLVEEVDRQDTLDGVAVHVDLLADLEVAQRHARKALGQGPVEERDGRVRRPQQRRHHRQTVDVVLRTHAEKRVQQNDLDK